MRSESGSKPNTGLVWLSVCSEDQGAIDGCMIYEDLKPGRMYQENLDAIIAGSVDALQRAEYWD